MKELKEIIRKAYVVNEPNFKVELRRIFKENEYVVNEQTTVNVRGYFDEVEVCPYIQFDIETDHEHFLTDHYKYNFSIRNNVRKDEPSDVISVTALTLFYDDLKMD